MRWTFILGIILIVIGIILISIPFISNAIKENSINQTNRNVFISIGVISFVIGIISIIIGFYTKRLGSNKSTKTTTTTPTSTKTTTRIKSIPPDELNELNNEFNEKLKSKYSFSDNQLKYIYKEFNDNELMTLFYISDVKTDEIPDIKILRSNINEIKSKYSGFINMPGNLIHYLRFLNGALNFKYIRLKNDRSLSKKIDEKLKILENKN